VQTVKGRRTDVDDTVTYGYDASGTLVSVTNALGQQTQVTAHDGRVTNDRKC
jgi:YD repeat-containing protein